MKRAATHADRRVPRRHPAGPGATIATRPRGSSRDAPPRLADRQPRAGRRWRWSARWPLWWLVASEPEFSIFVRVPLAYKNLSDDLEISAEPVNTVSLELHGPSGELSAIADASGGAPAGGDRGYDRRARRASGPSPSATDNVKLARGVRLVRAIPSEARFQFEERAARAGERRAAFRRRRRQRYGIESIRRRAERTADRRAGQPGGANPVRHHRPDRRFEAVRHVRVSRQRVCGRPLCAVRRARRR